MTRLHLPDMCWAMERSALDRLVGIYDSDIPAAAFSSSSGGAAASSGLVVVDGVAKLSILGPMMRDLPEWFGYYGIVATSTVSVRALLLEAVSSPSVERIEIDVDSPGGSMSGVHDLAEDIAAAGKIKPVSAHGLGMIASAAYYVASQAGELTAGKGTLVGSIGVYLVLRDWSAMYESEGIRTHVVSSHELKGVGVPGAKITDAQLEDMQRMVDDATTLFVETAADGRGMSEADMRENATGQVWLGDEAASRGLIDRVTRDSAAISTALEGAPGEGSMSDTQHADLVAKIDDLSEKMEGLVEANAALKIKVGAQESALASQASELASTKEDTIKGIIAQNGDRITPAMKASVEAYAEMCAGDVERFRSFVESLPVQARAKRVSADDAPAVDAETVPDLSESQLTVCRSMGLTPQEFSKAGVGTDKPLTLCGKAFASDEGGAS